MPVVVRTARCSRWDASRSGTRVGAVLALIAMSVVLVASLMVGAPRAGAATDDCARPPSGSIRVVMVVDAGGGSPIVTCLVVPDGITGSKLLAARAAQLGVAPPSYAGSGLLCTIDGAPASGCAETSAGSYWANFSGTSGTWVYSSYNPFIRHLRDGDIEGWRYVVLRRRRRFRAGHRAECVAVPGGDRGVGAPRAERCQRLRRRNHRSADRTDLVRLLRSDGGRSGGW